MAALAKIKLPGGIKIPPECLNITKEQGIIILNCINFRLLIFLRYSIESFLNKLKVTSFYTLFELIAIFFKLLKNIFTPIL